MCVLLCFRVQNEARLLAGKSSLGFLNPLLYSTLGPALNDVTEGTNMGCGNVNGFTAAKGWDPVTGFGTPDYGNMVKVALAL
jgi:tripeptidyl-peptidase-1